MKATIHTIERRDGHLYDVSRVDGVITSFAVADHYSDADVGRTWRVDPPKPIASAAGFRVVSAVQTWEKEIVLVLEDGRQRCITSTDDLEYTWIAPEGGR